jgi:hypothetical protein
MTPEDSAAIEALLPRNSRTGEIQFTALVDDLADVLSRSVVGWLNVIGVDLAQYPDVERVMARYRAYKANRSEMIRETLDEHAETLRRLGDG